MKIRKRFYASGLIILLVLVFVGLFLVDIGINSKFFIKKHFNQAFQYRLTGDCVSFVEYIYQDKGKWNDRCEKEKSREKEPIRKFDVLTVTHKFTSDKAFLQVELTRNIKDKEAYTYSASYEMKKSGLIWRILNEIK
jgi:hypothetical protein